MIFNTLSNISSIEVVDGGGYTWADRLSYGDKGWKIT
jgi:hypothetical protein